MSQRKDLGFPAPPTFSVAGLNSRSKADVGKMSSARNSTSEAERFPHAAGTPRLAKATASASNTNFHTRETHSMANTPQNTSGWTYYNKQPTVSYLRSKQH